MEQSETRLSIPTLLELFNDGLEKWTEFEKAGRVEENKVMAAIEVFHKASQLVDKNSLFSANETLEDIMTSSLNYLTIPYYLSELYQKLPRHSPAERCPILARSKEFLERYLSICVNYKILSTEDISVYEREADPDAGTLRNEKIARLRQLKSIDEKKSKKI